MLPFMEPELMLSCLLNHIVCSIICTSYRIFGLWRHWSQLVKYSLFEETLVACSPSLSKAQTMPKKTGRGGRRNQQRNSNKPSSSSKEALPAEFLVEILIRTPVKFLVRSRCVSKSWYALIHHPSFIKLHLTFNLSRNNKTILSNSYNPVADFGLKRVISVRGINDPPETVLPIHRLSPVRRDYPRKVNFPDFSQRMVLAGSINGIVCLTHFREMREDVVVLWNPAINCWKPIALPRTKSWQNVNVGLGFDNAGNDFKIICMVPLTDLNDLGWSRVEIYSASRDSWEDVDERGIIPFRPAQNYRHSIFIVKDVPYWMGFAAQPGDSGCVLGRIDPSTGLYKKVKYPQHDKGTDSVHAVNWKDLVTALVTKPGEYDSQMVDLYVLDENTDEWTKMYSIGPLGFKALRTPQCFCTGEIVVETWAGGSVLTSAVTSYFCDPKSSHLSHNHEVQVLYPCWYESYCHIESLVRVKGMVQIEKEHKHKKTDPRVKDWYFHFNCFLKI